MNISTRNTDTEISFLDLLAGHEEELERIKKEDEHKARQIVKNRHLDIPETLVKLHAREIIDTERSEARCLSCKHDTERVLSCRVQSLVYDGKNLWFPMRPCPYCEQAKMTYEYEKAMGKMLVSPKFRTRTFETFYPSPITMSIFQFCESWIEMYQPGQKGLYFYGGFGSGKTHLAVASILALRDKYHVGCLFMAMAEFLDSIKAGFKDGSDSKTFDLFKNAPVLVIDDLGEGRTEKNGMLSSWARERLYALINYRYEHELTTIVTSKYDLEGLSHVTGPAITSRLAEMCFILHDRETDFRLRNMHVIE